MSVTNYGVVFVNVTSLDEAKAIAKSLVESKLAACVNIFPVHSIYNWKGELCSEDSYNLLIKTNLDKFDILESKLRELHSDEVPEIIALPIVSGYAPYMQWMAEQIKG
ncbi:MAG: divalent-cation tolerance protein CutA [Okeania sp. SIO3I5]|uniref:divalent-cation tolerance protein CutA n=1 Tax=Okeania sp. SIO3I5 TaxID=2607805 RepID=UPI0013BB2DAA|nr:divalent-cation tolerance protein CutA [Okeania sp. SIO3I5]NEQ35399.1 divalent-cation tolerance protein CutA [Okeania sp. SIO3I5]